MERKDKVICSVVGFLGLLSAAFSFAAEATKTTASQIAFTSPTTCIYPISPAVGLGLAAAMTLMVAQIVISVTTRRVGCNRAVFQSNSSWTIAVISFVVSWITFVIALAMILQAEQYMYFNDTNCNAVKPGFFAGAAVLSLVSVIIRIVYYLALESTKIRIDPVVGTAAAPNQSGIAMGQPQFPPPQFPPPDTQAPVFVHEDTYMRRQFT